MDSIDDGNRDIYNDPEFRHAYEERSDAYNTLADVLNGADNRLIDNLIETIEKYDKLVFTHEVIKTIRKL